MVKLQTSIDIFGSEECKATFGFRDISQILTKLQSMILHYVYYDLDPNVKHTRNFAQIPLLYVIYVPAKLLHPTV